MGRVRSVCRLQGCGVRVLMMVCLLVAFWCEASFGARDG